MAAPSMDSIKKKMASMKNEKDQAIERAEQNEQRAVELEEAIKAVSITFLLKFLSHIFKLEYTKRKEKIKI